MKNDLLPRGEKEPYLLLAVITFPLLLGGEEDLSGRTKLRG
jgi:hypothetical protein